MPQPRSLLLRAALVLSLPILIGLMALRTSEATAGPLLQATTTPPGQLALPTATATIIGGATATPSRTPTFPVILLEAAGEANLRAGPGLGFDVVGTITAGNPLQIIGRSPNFPWLVIEWQDGPGGVAWVFEDLVIVQGDVTTIPIYADPSAPTIDPTTAAIQATATILLQTPGAAQTATAQALIVPTGIFTSTPDPSGDAQPSPASQFTAPPPTRPASTLPEREVETSALGIPPAMVILTLGSLGILALIVSVLRPN